MTRSLPLCSALVAVLLAAAAHAGTSFDDTHITPGVGSIDYRVFLPDGYDPAGPELPVVLYLHSAAERGNSVDDIFANSYGGFLWTNDWVTHLVDATQSGDHRAILVMPQSGLGQVWNSMTAGDNWGVGNYNNAAQNATPISPRLQLAVDALGSVLGTQRADPDRVYVTGPSMGGFGTWDALARFPDLFAAGMPLSGGGNFEAAGTYLAGKPVWMYHGAIDGLIPAANTDQLYQAMQNAGGNALYSRISNEGHGGFENFYAPDTYTTVSPSQPTGLGPDVYDWLVAQSLSNQGPVDPPALEAAPIVLNLGAGQQSNNNSFDYTADGSRMIVFNHMEAGDVLDMKDINGNPTGISVTRTGEVGPGGGTSAPTAPVSGVFPRSSTETSLFTFGALIGQGATMSFVFSGLDDDTTYTFDVFGAVDTPLDITSVTQYVLTGLTTQIDQVDVINNHDTFVTFTDVQSVGGEVTLTVNGLGGSLGYINGLRITPNAVPEPAAAMALAFGVAVMGARRRARR